MFTELGHRDTTADLGRRLSAAARPSASLFAEVLATGARLATLRSMGKTARLDRFIACEAWSEAALELLGLEAPQWSVQRLCHDDGEWLCTLTRFPELPDWLDDSVEARHPVMALAILAALLDIRERTATVPAARHPLAAGVPADCTDYR